MNYMYFMKWQCQGANIVVFCLRINVCTCLKTSPKDLYSQLMNQSCYCVSAANLHNPSPLLSIQSLTVFSSRHFPKRVPFIFNWLSYTSDEMQSSSPPCISPSLIFPSFPFISNLFYSLLHISIPYHSHSLDSLLPLFTYIYILSTHYIFREIFPWPFKRLEMFLYLSMGEGKILYH